MKKILVLVAVLSFCWVYPAYADRVTLGTSETLAVPTSQLLDWEISKINAKDKILQVRYRFLATTDQSPIPTPDTSSTYRTWTCQDRAAQLVADCTGVGTPYACCTGVGTGTGCDPGSTCFTDVFGFLMRSQDVGTKIGVGLRTLIWNKFKADVVSAGNTGTFDTN